MTIRKSKITNAKESYEAKILETLINNAERLAVIEKKIDSEFDRLDTKIDNVNAKLNWLFAAVFAVAASILAALYSEPLLSALGR